MAEGARSRWAQTDDRSGATTGQRRHALALGTCYFVVFAGIAGLVGLLPVQLRRLGADPAATGVLLASAYAALAASTVLAGHLAARLQRRRVLLMLGGLAAIPLAWQLSTVAAVPQLWVLLTALWFAFGVPMTMVRNLTGLVAAGGARGQSFGWLTLASGLGLLAGGWVNGPIVDRWGFPGLYAAFAAVFALIPVVVRFVPDPVVATAPDSHPRPYGPFGHRWFAVLFAASILAQAANILLFLTRPLLMDAQGFDATAISTANAVGSLGTLPLPLLVGWLADRTGRTPLLVACFLAPVLGLLVQIGATSPWQFWLGSLLSTVVGVSLVVGSAIAADRFPPSHLDAALSWLNATAWIGIVLGLGIGGVAIQAVRMTPTLLAGALVGASAVALLALVRAPLAAPGRTEGEMRGREAPGRVG